MLKQINYNGCQISVADNEYGDVFEYTIDFDGVTVASAGNFGSADEAEAAAKAHVTANADGYPVIVAEWNSLAERAFGHKPTKSFDFNDVLKAF